MAWTTVQPLISFEFSCSYLKGIAVCGKLIKAVDRHPPYGITVLPATQHRWTNTHCFKRSQTGQYPIFLSCMDGRLSYILRWFVCPQTVTYPGTNHLIAFWLGVEPTALRSLVQHALSRKYCTTVQFTTCIHQCVKKHPQHYRLWLRIVRF